jgi:hypothetical protein
MNTTIGFLYGNHENIQKVGQAPRFDDLRRSAPDYFVHRDDRANIGEASIGNAAAKWALAGSRRRRPIVTLAERDRDASARDCDSQDD